MTSTVESSAAGKIPLARIGLVVGFLVVVALAVATLPGVGEVRERLAAADVGWLAVAALCALASMLGFAAALWDAFERMLPWRRAIELGFAEQATNVLLPAGGAGGPALGVVVMRRAGVPPRLAADRHAVLFLATSAASFAGLIGAGVLASVGVLPADAPLLATVLPALGGAAALAAAVLFAVRPAPRAAGATGARRAIVRAWRFVHRGARATVLLIRRGDALLPLGALAYYAFDIAVLAAAFQALGGGGPPAGELVIAYTLGHAGALLPTPAGIGGTEGGLIAMLVAFGTPLELATAAVLCYRVFQLGVPVVLGGACLPRMRRLAIDASPRPRGTPRARLGRSQR